MLTRERKISNPLAGGKLFLSADGQCIVSCTSKEVAVVSTLTGEVWNHKFLTLNDDPSDYICDISSDLSTGRIVFLMDASRLTHTINLKEKHVASFYIALSLSVFMHPGTQVTCLKYLEKSDRAILCTNKNRRVYVFSPSKRSGRDVFVGLDGWLNCCVTSDESRAIVSIVDSLDTIICLDLKTLEVIWDMNYVNLACPIAPFFLPDSNVLIMIGYRGGMMNVVQVFDTDKDAIEHVDYDQGWITNCCVTGAQDIVFINQYNTISTIRYDKDSLSFQGVKYERMYGMENYGTAIQTCKVQTSLPDNLFISLANNDFYQKMIFSKWSDKTHHFFSTEFKQFIFNIMCCAFNAKEPRHLPVLPIEIWLIVFECVEHVLSGKFRKGYIEIVEVDGSIDLNTSEDEGTDLARYVA